MRKIKSKDTMTSTEEYYPKDQKSGDNECEETRQEQNLRRTDTKAWHNIGIPLLGRMTRWFDFKTYSRTVASENMSSENEM